MDKSLQKILLVDDETDIIEFLSYNLKKEGFQIFSATSAREAVETAREQIPHLILLDVMMPEIDGFDACYELKKIPELQDTLIVFLSANSDHFAQLTGFDAGADDFISKPIKPRLLISRINALLRLQAKKNFLTSNINNIIKVNDLVINKEEYIVHKDNKKISLRKKEFELLMLLASKPNKVFTREEILSIVWNNEIVWERSVDVHVSKIREKLHSDNIKTISGVGYKYEV